MSHVFDVLKVKSGPAAGTLVPLASIVVTDQSGVKMKVVLWRQVAFWVLTVHPGDVLLLTGKVWHSQPVICRLYGGGASPCYTSVVKSRDFSWFGDFIRSYQLQCLLPSNLHHHLQSNLIPTEAAVYT